MAHEILTIKLCELEEQFARLNSRIHLSEIADHDQLRQEIRGLSKECTEAEFTLQKKIATVQIRNCDNVGKHLWRN